MAGAAEVEIWGTGNPVREFMYVDDMAEAAVFLMRHYSGDGHVNVGTGEGVTIRDLARTLADVIGFQGGFRFDVSKPDGMPRKLLQSSRLYEMGWRPATGLTDGLRRAYDWYLSNVADREPSTAREGAEN
jgi:GDP-L-fucose synthase